MEILEWKNTTYMKNSLRFKQSEEVIRELKNQSIKVIQLRNRKKKE
jgi:hypothetical protein